MTATCDLAQRPPPPKEGGLGSSHLCVSTDMSP